MNMMKLTSGALVALVLAGGIAGVVSAQSASQTAALTQEQAVGIALIEVPGDVTEVESEDYRGQQVFEVEILGSDGVEMEVMIAADTGEILKVKADGADCEKDDGDDNDDDEA